VSGRKQIAVSRRMSLCRRIAFKRSPYFFESLYTTGPPGLRPRMTT
jgi:hypothetical protein